MNIISVATAVAVDFFLYFWPVSVKNRFIRLGILITLVILAIVLLKFGDVEESETPPSLSAVKVTTVEKISGTNQAAFIGTVRAVSESDMQFEIGGRITSVPVTVGQTVQAGTIIATVENSAQSAALVQARGSYDAALASAALSEVSVADAERNLLTAKQTAISTLQSSYSTTNLQLRSVLDQFFGNPDSFIPGVRIKTVVPASELNSARISLQKNLPVWETEVNSLKENSNLSSAIVDGIMNVEAVLSLTDIFAASIDDSDQNDSLGGRSVLSYAAEVATTRSTLIGVKTSLQSANIALKNAEDALSKSKITSTQNKQNSLATAQVTQARGSLMAAQAQYEKTIVRAPINGTVDVLRVRTGEYVAANTPVALVTGGSGFEISLFVGERDADLFKVGGKVTVDDDNSAIVTSVSNTIDTLTLKREVILALEDNTSYASGDTVNLQLETLEVSQGKIEVPITALKFINEDAFMYKVEGDKLTVFAVVIGKVFGGNVEITEGLDATSEFVIDVRGKSAGQTVRIID